MKKKKLLFVIESLVCAGAEKSLVTLLNLIDYTKYEVDLQLFSFGGDFEPLLPKEVNILPSLAFFEYTSIPLKTVILSTKDKKQKSVLRSRIKYTFMLRTGKYTNPQKAVLFWQICGKHFEVMNKRYDVAIAYAQGQPTFYVADFIQADKKLAWVNSIYNLTGEYRQFVEKKYSYFNYIVCVSEAGRKAFTESFLSLTNKVKIIYDINDPKFINKMSQIQAESQKLMADGKVRLLTIGRMSKQKGYDIALDACQILKDKKIDFCWYIIGTGVLKEEIENGIRARNIETNIKLLGVKPNPYPFIAQADIYVQTSRFEGFGLAITEARMLNTPIVTTCFDAVYDQMVNGENGLVVDMNAKAVADGILKLVEDKKLYNHIVDYQSKEKKGNTEEIEKFYLLVN